jgi:hypothetical protein
VGGATLTALLFGAIFFTRWTPVLAICGLLVLVAAGGIVTGAASGTNLQTAIAAGAIGLGVGASVSPALFVTGFSLESGELPRVFALIELLRGVAAFLAGPLLLHLAETAGAGPAEGTEVAALVATGTVLLGAALAVTVFVLGGGRLQEPDIEGWLEGENPAIEA